MDTRKAILVIAGLAVLTVCSSFSTNRHQNSAPAPRQIADGGAPLPPIPRGVASLSAV